MPAIGPQLPPQLAKRKRTPDADADDVPPKQPRRAAPSQSAPVTSPANRDDISLDDSDAESPAPRLEPPASDSDGHGPATSAGRRLGPSPPPAANGDEINLSDSDPDSDSDSDDYGPAPPSASASRPAAPVGPSLPAAAPGPQRDAWMLAPPPPGSVFAERDPTRIRSRKFASKPGAGAGAAPSSGPSVWTETPEEKLRRLRDSVLGRADPSPAPAAAAAAQRSAEQLERDRRIADSVEARRGASLYEEHSKRRRGETAAKAGDEDDPSKRAFDRDKDMALGGKIGTAQRRELISKSANFGGRFQKGSYL